MKYITFLLLITIFNGCKKPTSQPVFTETQIDLTTHKLTAYSYIKNSKYFVVFETGLGDAAVIWTEKNIHTQIAPFTDVVMYDRAGYGKSAKGPAPRDINKLRDRKSTRLNSSHGGISRMPSSA